MIYLVYSALLAVGLLLTLPFWLWKMATVGKYRAGLWERLGRLPARVRRGASETMWVHAVSVGEVLAVAGLVEAWRERHPEWEVFVSTTTATGQKLARERFGADKVFYFPLDLGFAIGPWLEWLLADLVVLAETEFWPNFLRRARRSGARIAVVNARISDRSLPGYRRWKRLLAPVLGNVDLFLAQSETDAARLGEIGARPGRVLVSGNLKFDGSLRRQARLRRSCGSGWSKPGPGRCWFAAAPPRRRRARGSRMRNPFCWRPSPRCWSGFRQR